MKAENKYDFILVGMGASGGLLLHELAIHFPDKRVLVLEKTKKNENDKTWSFWETEQTDLEHLVTKQWKKGQFFSSRQQITFELSPYHYKTIRSLDFYAYLHQLIEQYPTYSFLQEMALKIIEESDQVLVQTSHETYSADYVFDSRLPSKKELKNHTGVSQHFLGQVIETSHSVFDPNIFTMMDYRLTHQGTTSFMYVLPFSETQALLEFTYFSNQFVDDNTYREFIEDYARTILKLKDYQIIEEEKGIIPMNMKPFHQNSTQRVIKIGTAGGAVKPSSGYSFAFSRKRAKQIIQQIKTGEPVTFSPSKKFRFYDHVFLKILQNKNHLGEELFDTMYANNQIQEIFRFLDEESSWSDEFKILSSFAKSKHGHLFVKNALTF